MTATERRKLAQAARALAMECVAGTAPEFDGSLFYGQGGAPACALAHVEVRAGVPGSRMICNYYFAGSAPWLDMSELVSEALFPAREGETPMPDGAVVFPLLALADELDELEAQDG